LSAQPAQEAVYSFRIVGIPREQIHLVEEYLQDLRFTTGVYYKDSSKLVVCVPLVEGMDYQSLFRLVESKVLSEISHGVFVSHTATQDVTGIEFPDFALEVYQRLGGNIDISLIFAPDREHGSL
jgi:hypothetical protein